MELLDELLRVENNYLEVFKKCKAKSRKIVEQPITFKMNPPFARISTVAYQCLIFKRKVVVCKLFFRIRIIKILTNKKEVP